MKDGEAGVPGESVTLDALDAGDSHCPQGGVQLRTPTATSILCNGSDLTSPPGTVVAFAGETAPTGWLICDGSLLNRSEHPRLFQAIGTAWGAPDGNTFYLPDLRGRFIRGVDSASGRDPDAQQRVAAALNGNTGDRVGTLQSDALQAHTHVDTGHYHDSDTVNDFGGGSFRNGYYFGKGLYTYDDPRCIGCAFHIGHAQLGNPTDSSSGAGTPRLSVESRPANAALTYIIKE